MAHDEDRKELLLQMYDQLHDNINTRITVVWQSVGALIGAFAIFALTEKQVISLDVATALVVLVAGWLLTLLDDAAYWYNRKIAIAGNIERQFLTDADLREVHYYFGRHRPHNTMITHLRIQYGLGVGIGAIVLVSHFLTRVAPYIFRGVFDPQRGLPYAVLPLVAVCLLHVRSHRDRSYAEFLANSPGKEIDATGLVYGEGHAFSRQFDARGAESQQSR